MFTYFIFVFCCVVCPVSLGLFLLCWFEQLEWEKSGLKKLGEVLGKTKVFFTTRYLIVFVISLVYIISYLTY